MASAQQLQEQVQQQQQQIQEQQQQVQQGLDLAESNRPPPDVMTTHHQVHQTFRTKLFG